MAEQAPDKQQRKAAPRSAAPSTAARKRSPRRRSQAPTPPEGRAAALVVAHNQARRIAATVRATRAIPGVDLVLVVDDGSHDNTQELARNAGAVVVRHSHRRGRSASIETGSAVIAMRDEEGADPRVILLMEPGLGNAAIGAAPLVEAVLERVADMAVGLADGAARQQGVAAGAARKAIASLSGWSPLQPLSRVRCLTREALELALPLARGAGLETALTLDVIDAGLTVTEVACDMRHRPSKASARPLVRAGQYRDVMMAISSRRVRVSIRSTQHAVEDTFHVASNSGKLRVRGAGGATGKGES